MHETFLTRQDFNERAELLNGRDATFISRAKFDLSSHLTDVVDGSINLLAVDPSDSAHATIFD